MFVSKKLSKYDSKYWTEAVKTQRSTINLRFLTDEQERQITFSIVMEVKKVCDFVERDVSVEDSTMEPLLESIDRLLTSTEAPTETDAGTPADPASASGAGPSGTATESVMPNRLVREFIAESEALHGWPYLPIVPVSAATDTDMGLATDEDDLQDDELTQQCSQKVLELQEKLDQYTGDDSLNDLDFLEELPEELVGMWMDNIATCQDAVTDAAEKTAKEKQAFELIDEEANEVEEVTRVTRSDTTPIPRKKKMTKQQKDDIEARKVLAQKSVAEAEALEKERLDESIEQLRKARE